MDRNDIAQGYVSFIVKPWLTKFILNLNCSESDIPQQQVMLDMFNRKDDIPDCL